MKRAPGSQVRDGGKQLVRDRGLSNKRLPYGQTQTMADIQRATAGVNGADPYIEDPEAPSIMPDRIGSVRMSLDDACKGTGRG